MELIPSIGHVSIEFTCYLQTFDRDIGEKGKRMWTGTYIAFNVHPGNFGGVKLQRKMDQSAVAYSKSTTSCIQKILVVQINLP